MRKLIITILVLQIVFSCSKNKSYDQESEKNISVMAMSLPDIAEAKVEDKDFAPPYTPVENINENLPKKIIYSAGIKFRVLHLKESDKNIRLVVGKYGGYISNSTQNNDDGNQNIILTVRIPAAKFQNFIESSEKESIYTDYKTVKSDDISAEFYDNELRIKSKKEAFEKYLTILKQAKTVTEVLAVEEQLRIIREEIEAKEGRQKFINNQVDFSTINLHIYQVIPEESKHYLPIFTQILEKISGGFHFFLSVFIGLFYWIPFILIAVLIFILLKRWKRSKKV